MLLLCRRASHPGFHQTQGTIGNPIGREQYRLQSHSVYSTPAVCDQCYAQFPVAIFFSGPGRQSACKWAGLAMNSIVEARF
jgi:hypothetical protein